jgi:hypothetical protein
VHRIEVRAKNKINPLAILAAACCIFHFSNNDRAMAGLLQASPTTTTLVFFGIGLFHLPEGLGAFREIFLCRGFSPGALAVR